MMLLAAYANRLSVRPGETIRFHAAHAASGPVSAKVTRVISADANPAGPGIRTQSVDTELNVIAEPDLQRVPHGSFARIDGVDDYFQQGDFSLYCLVFPTVRVPVEQALLSRNSDDGGVSLCLDERGAVCARAVVEGAAHATTELAPLALRRWHAVWLTYDGQQLRVGHAPLKDRMGADVAPRWAQLDLALGTRPAKPTPLMVAASNSDLPALHYTGKLEAPALFDRVLDEAQIQSLVAGGQPVAAVAQWDFALGTATNRIVDVGPNALHGQLCNTPSRGMTGAFWAGEEMCYRHAPKQYGAIHFHADDIDDCEWPVCYEWTVPEGTRSAVYALELEAGNARENVPFHVVPPRGQRQAKIAVLASTFTYTIYGNHLRADWDSDPQWQRDWREQTAQWAAIPSTPAIIASTDSPRTTITLMAAASASRRGIARC